MKKLKIFLLLSILLCLGFVLSSEVHAQDDVLPDPTTLPTGTGYGCAFNHDGTRLAVAHSNSPCITIYDTTTTPYTKLPDPTSLPTGIGNDCAFNHDGTRLAVAHSNSPYITIYDTTTTPYTKLSDPTSLPTDTGNDCTFNHDGTILAVVHSNSPYITIYDTTTTPYTKLPDPTTLPTGNGRGCAFNHDGTRLAVAHSNSPFITGYRVSPLSNTPKPFEVGDVLPAGYIKISWDFTDKPIAEGFIAAISSSGDFIIQIRELEEEGIELYINYELFYVDTPSYTIITLTEPCTITSINFFPDDQGYDYDEYIGDALLWEVLPPEYIGDYDDLYDGELLDIEEDYILPQSKVGIKLLYNNTGGPKSGTITYTFGTYGQIILTAQEDNLSSQVTSAEITYNFTNPNWNIYMIDDSLASQSFGSTRGILFAGVLLDFSWATEEERTITDITVEGDLDIDVIFTRILTEEELAYQEGYSNGYTTAREIFGWKDGDTWYNGIDAWNLGEKYARELYGFYDSTTDEWLSVDDYIARYGTGNGGGNGNGSPGASDFYNNFDKYFIPAMIIVFGGAIVLTILKVFKGRE